MEISGSPNEQVKILYTNYRGETSQRIIVPLKIYFGSTNWHKEPQWLLDAFDKDKNAHRAFAVKDIKSWSAISLKKI